jgi:hypothetical protein
MMRKTMKKSTYDDLDKAMLTWFHQLTAGEQGEQE